MGMIGQMRFSEFNGPGVARLSALPYPTLPYLAFCAVGVRIKAVVIVSRVKITSLESRPFYSASFLRCYTQTIMQRMKSYKASYLSFMGGC